MKGNKIRLAYAQGMRLAGAAEEDALWKQRGGIWLKWAKSWTDFPYWERQFLTARKGAHKQVLESILRVLDSEPDGCGWPQDPELSELRRAFMAHLMDITWAVQDLYRCFTTGSAYSSEDAEQLWFKYIGKPQWGVVWAQNKKMVDLFEQKNAATMSTALERLRFLSQRAASGSGEMPDWLAWAETWSNHSKMRNEFLQAYPKSVNWALDFYEKLERVPRIYLDNPSDRRLWSGVNRIRTSIASGFADFLEYLMELPLEDESREQMEDHWDAFMGKPYQQEWQRASDLVRQLKH
jgi:hypothetical protein